VAWYVSLQAQYTDNLLIIQRKSTMIYIYIYMLINLPKTQSLKDPTQCYYYSSTGHKTYVTVWLLWYMCMNINRSMNENL